MRRTPPEPASRVGSREHQSAVRRVDGVGDLAHLSGSLIPWHGVRAMRSDSTAEENTLAISK